jgi:hypothetical protein
MLPLRATGTASASNERSPDASDQFRRLTERAHSSDPSESQQIDSRSPSPGAALPSPQAAAAARDLTFEALVETAVVMESYARSLGEAAWRTDRVTVEAHLRQLRACVIACIDIFKTLDGVKKKGGGS